MRLGNNQADPLLGPHVHPVFVMTHLKTGAALAATVVLFYALCTLLWLSFPEPFLDFMNALFHGLDFRRLQAERALSWCSLIYPAVVLAVWLFAAGALFLWIQKRLERRA